MNTIEELVKDIADRYTYGWEGQDMPKGFVSAKIIPDERKELDSYLRLLLGRLVSDDQFDEAGYLGLYDSDKWIIYEEGQLISQAELTRALQKVMGDDDENKSEK